MRDFFENWGYQLSIHSREQERGRAGKAECVQNTGGIRSAHEQDMNASFAEQFCDGCPINATPLQFLWRDDRVIMYKVPAMSSGVIVNLIDGQEQLTVRDPF
jgi:hypothetical protein